MITASGQSLAKRPQLVRQAPKTNMDDRREDDKTVANKPGVYA